MATTRNKKTEETGFFVDYVKIWKIIPGSLYTVPADSLLRTGMVNAFANDDPALKGQRGNYISGYHTNLSGSTKISFGQIIGARAANIFAWPYAVSHATRLMLCKGIDEIDCAIRRGLSRIFPGIIRPTRLSQNLEPSIFAIFFKAVVMIILAPLDLVTYPLAKASNRAITAVSSGLMKNTVTHIPVTEKQEPSSELEIPTIKKQKPTHNSELKITECLTNRNHKKSAEILQNSLSTNSAAELKHHPKEQESPAYHRMEKAKLAHKAQLATDKEVSLRHKK